MKVENLNPSVWARTWLVADADTGLCALVDPVYDYMESYDDGDVCHSPRHLGNRFPLVLARLYG